MKTFALVLVASILATATAHAAPQVERLDGYKLFEDIASRGGQ